MAKERPEHKPFKAVLIIGNEITIPTPIKDAIKAFGEEKYITIGSSRADTSLQEVQDTLNSKIDSDTIIYLDCHGQNIDGKHYADGFSGDPDSPQHDMVAMGKLLKVIQDAHDGPLEIHVNSCYSGCAITEENISPLKEGTIVISYSSAEDIKYGSQVVLEGLRQKYSYPEASSISRFTMELARNISQTASIGVSTNEGSIKYIAAPPSEITVIDKEWQGYLEHKILPEIKQFCVSMEGKVNDSSFHRIVGSPESSPIGIDGVTEEGLAKTISSFVAHNIGIEDIKTLDYLKNPQNKQALEYFFEKERKFSRSEGFKPLVGLMMFDPDIDDNIFDLVFKAGADPNLQDKQGNSLLHLAIESGSDAAFDALLVAEADCNVRNEDGQTPLHYAAFESNGHAVETLLESGADKDAQNNDGDTSLHIAANAEDIEIVNVLMGYSARLDIQNTKGETAMELLLNKEVLSDEQNIELLEVFLKEGNMDMANLLFRRGVRVPEETQEVGEKLARKFSGLSPDKVKSSPKSPKQKKTRRR